MAKWIVETVEDGQYVRIGEVESQYYKGVRGAKRKAIEKYPDKTKGKQIAVWIGSDKDEG